MSQAPSERINYRYDSETQTTTIEINDLSLYLNTKREFYWTLAFLIIAIVFIIYDIGSDEESDNTTISILVILSICAIASLINLLSLIIYYCFMVSTTDKNCQIIISKQENKIILNGHGFWNRFICGCLFGRSIYLNNAELKNSFIQYRLRHAQHQKCSLCAGDSLWCYLRGYDELINPNDDINNQLDIEQEEQTLCHQKYNISTNNILKNVLTYQERKWLVLYMIRNSHCAVLKSVDNVTDEFSLILPSEDDRTQMFADL